jgi:predicted nucleic acid-binding protein
MKFRVVLDTNIILAHYIVTNDKHFNVLKRISFPKISLLKIKEFGALLFNAPFA